MNIRQAALALFICLLPAGPGWADGPVAWQDVRCEPLVGTLAGFTVGAALDAVGRDPGSPYYQHYQQGNYGACIDTLLAILGEGEQMVRDQGGDQDPRQAGLLEYSGHPWRFWLKVERLGRGAEKAGLTGALKPEFQVVWRELTAAFMPVLDPAVVLTPSLAPLSEEP